MEIQVHPNCVWDSSKETLTYFVCANCGIIHQKRNPRAKNPIRPCVAMPTYGKLVKNFSRSAFYWTKNRFKVLKKALQQARMKICRVCPSDMFFLKKNRIPKCRHKNCGCNLWAKTRINVQVGKSDCPLGHWPAIDKDGKEI